jgi:hypothetical protein
VIAPVNHYFADVAVLFHGDDDVHGRFGAIENMVKLFEVIFDVLTDCGRDFNVTTSVLKPHDFDSLLTLMNRLMLAKLRTRLANYNN